MMTVLTWATTMPVLLLSTTVLEGILFLKQFLHLSFGGEQGWRGGGHYIQSVINEHFKRPNCGC